MKTYKTPPEELDSIKLMLRMKDYHNEMLEKYKHCLDEIYEINQTMNYSIIAQSLSQLRHLLNNHESALREVETAVSQFDRMKKAIKKHHGIPYEIYKDINGFVKE